MDPNKLQRDAGKVQAALKEVGDSLVAVKGVKVYIPSRYTERRLASIGAESNTVGIFAITLDDQYYAVNLTMASMRLEPTSMNTVMIEGSEYIEFYFEPGSVVVPDVELLKDDTMPYYVYNEFVSGGHIPWFLTYLDLAKLFDSAPYHAGLNVGANSAVLEMIMATIARSPEDRTVYYRHFIEKMGDIGKRPPDYIDFSSVIFNATNTSARMIGSYFEEGVSSSLINPSERRERIEDILRK